MDREAEYRACAEQVARELLGEPNRHLSNGKEIRWGSHGSLALNVARGIFFDHEKGEGGGVRWLLHQERSDLDEDGITEWLVSRGYVTASGPQNKIVAEYDYTDASGEILYQVVRFEPKDFRQRKPNGAGDWDWSVKGVRQVPYRLPALVEATKTGQPVLIVEGEKDVDNLHALGVVATCNAGGAGKWHKALSEYFRDADVILSPDNDAAGYSHINVVGKALTGIAQRVRVLMLQGLPDKGDASDWIVAGGTAEALWSLVDLAVPWVDKDVEQAANERRDAILKIGCATRFRLRAAAQ
jgi:hypothetical protein